MKKNSQNNEKSKNGITIENDDTNIRAKRSSLKINCEVSTPARNKKSQLHNKKELSSGICIRIPNLSLMCQKQTETCSLIDRKIN